MSNPAVTACIITFNEESNIRRCLESVKWADEIVVVDSNSTDATVEICREYTQKIYHREFEGHIEQKSYALQCAGNDWVLCIDADEELSPALISEIREGLEKEGDKFEGFFFPRHAFYLGRWINHCGWYPDYKLRLFRKSLGEWGGTNPHDKVELKGRTKHLRNDMNHYTYKDFSHHLKTIDDYSTIYAREARKRGERFSLAKLIFRPVFKFFEIYLYKKGCMDGLPGFIISVLYSYYVFLRYSKIWEADGHSSSLHEK